VVPVAFGMGAMCPLRRWSQNATSRNATNRTDAKRCHAMLRHRKRRPPKRSYQDEKRMSYRRAKTAKDAKKT
jgi:hypothetical protein